MKILSVVGARPNFVKITPLARTFAERGFHHVLVHTGQHYDYEMSKIFFSDLDLPEPDRHLGVGSGTHAVQTGKMMAPLEQIISAENPDVTLVVGDVNSTLAAAIASVKLHIPVAHVEAGYRSFDMRMPEEVNRVLVDRISQLLFAPTENAVLNLVNEGMNRESIHFVGNIMIEALLTHLEKAQKSQVVDSMGMTGEKYCVATFHRPQNVESRKPLKTILESLSEAPLPVIFPVHPRTQKAMKRHQLDSRIGENVIMTKPLGYLDFVRVMSSAACVVTDSGGIQEEALVLQVPCVTVRETTERVETVEAGANRLCTLDREQIKKSLKDALESNRTFEIPLFWDDRVSERIAEIIEREKFSIPEYSMI